MARTKPASQLGARAPRAPQGNYLFVAQVEAVQRESVLLDKIRPVAAVLVRILNIAGVSSSKRREGSRREAGHSESQIPRAACGARRRLAHSHYGLEPQPCQEAKVAPVRMA